MRESRSAFKAEFEVSPDITLGDYSGLKVEYSDPEVSDQQVTGRIEQIRDSKSTFVNEEPRPLADGDFAVISLESVSGVAEPIKTDEVTIQIAGPDTIEGFSENLRGMSPGRRKGFRRNLP